MWVVHSLDPAVDLQAGDLRRRLIEYVQDPSAVIRTLEREEPRVESELERQVLHRLVNAHYRVRAQWKVGYKRIDLVVEGGGKRLAVECDGDRSHPIERLAEDMERQAMLERLGWKFVRVRGTQFFRDESAALQPVFDALNRLGIPPELGRSESRPSPFPIDELKERVVRRAANLRQQWSEQEGAPRPPEGGRGRRGGRARQRRENPPDRLF
jgi:very-short-patch-repair endonuclease